MRSTGVAPRCIRSASNSPAGRCSMAPSWSASRPASLNRWPSARQRADQAGRKPTLGANDNIPNGITDEIRGGPQIELVHDARAMGFDRLDGDIERVPDLLVDLPFRDHLDNLPFAVRQAAFHALRLRLQETIQQHFGN